MNKLKNTRNVKYFIWYFASSKLLLPSFLLPQMCHVLTTRWKKILQMRTVLQILNRLRILRWPTITTLRAFQLYAHQRGKFRCPPNKDPKTKILNWELEFLTENVIQAAHPKRRRRSFWDLYFRLHLRQTSGYDSD